MIKVKKTLSIITTSKKNLNIYVICVFYTVWVHRTRIHLHTGWTIEY